MTKPETIYEWLIRFIMLDMALYHVLLGLVGMIYTNQLELLITDVFNFAIPINEITISLIRPLGAYVFAFGLFMLLPAYKPRKYRSIIYLGLVLLVIRVAQYAQMFVLDLPAGGEKVTSTLSLFAVCTITAAIFGFLLYQTRER